MQHMQLTNALTRTFNINQQTMATIDVILWVLVKSNRHGTMVFCIPHIFYIFKNILHVPHIDKDAATEYGRLHDAIW
jgi:hypothetical protein